MAPGLGLALAFSVESQHFKEGRGILILARLSGASWRWDSSLVDCSVLVLAVGISRLIFRSQKLYGMDSVNFALGMLDYAPQLHQPHPPGYFLYVKAAALLDYLFDDPNNTLVALSILSSCVTVVFIYLLATRWYGRDAGKLAGILFLLSPLAWFHGMVAFVYGVEAALSALLGWLCWRVYTGERNLVLVVSLVFVVAIGLRQSTALMLAPLWLLTLYRSGVLGVIQGGAVFVLGTLAWFVPMLMVSGGSEVYFGALNDLWERVARQHMVFVAPLSEAISVLGYHITLIVLAFGLCFAGFSPLLMMRGLSLSGVHDIRLFLTAWILPGLLFFTLIFIASTGLGYLLVIAVPLFILAGAKLSQWLISPALPMRHKQWLILLMISLNLGVFWFAPIYTSVAEVQGFEDNLTEVVSDVRAIFDPEDTLIIAVDTHKYGFRHAGYYLPEYQVIQYPEMRIENRMQLSVMQFRVTRLRDRLPLDDYKEFLLFPMYRGEELLNKVGLENNSYKEVKLGPYAGYKGKIEQLPLLFSKLSAAESG